MIDFNQIPIDLRTPGQYLETDASRANSGPITVSHRVLVIGQKLAAGTAPANAPVLVTVADQAEPLFGRGSMLANMFRYLKVANPWQETWALPVDDAGAGVQATGTITFGGAVTAAGTIALYIGGERVRLGVAAGATLQSIAIAMAAEIAANTRLPVTANWDVGSPNDVALTARHDGLGGNDIDVRVNYFPDEALPEGLTATITPMAGGATNPDLTAALAAIGDEQFHHVIHGYTDAANLALVENEMADRWGPLRQIPGFAWTAAEGTVGENQTLCDGRNSELSAIFGIKGVLEPPWIRAAVFGGVAAYYLNIDAGRPLQTLELRGLHAPVEGDRYTQAERNLLLGDGCSTAITDGSGRLKIERAVTTYQENQFGVDDTSLMDVQTIFILIALRDDIRALVSTKYPRHKLSDDGVNIAPGQAVMQPRIMRSELIARYPLWAERGWVDPSPEAYEQFKTDLVVERDGSDANRMNALIPPDVINQFRVFAAQIQFRR